MNWEDWTPCEMYGHSYELDGETYDSCLTRGEPRDTDEGEG